MAKRPDQPGDRATFIGDMVSDPNSVPDLMLLYGYLGASSEAEHERLYLRADLSQYVEIPTSAILRREEAPADRDPHGGITLWVKQDAKLIYKMAPGAQALAYYFAGQIAGAAAGGAPQPTPAGFGGPVALGNSQFIRSCIQCGPSFFWNCTFAVAGNGGIGPSFQGHTCPHTYPDIGCTLRVGGEIGPSYMHINCVPPTGPDCPRRVGAGIGPSYLGINCDPRSLPECTLRVDPSFFWNCTQVRVALGVSDVSLCSCIACHHTHPAVCTV